MANIESKRTREDYQYIYNLLHFSQKIWVTNNVINDYYDMLNSSNTIIENMSISNNVVDMPVWYEFEKSIAINNSNITYIGGLICPKQEGAHSMIVNVR